MNYVIGHLIGDFILQNTWMAFGKKRSSFICGVHVAVYSLCVWAFTGWPSWAMAIVAATHFAQDRSQFVPWSMRMLRQPNMLEAPLFPWSAIVVDQIWHLIVLWGIATYIGSNA